MNIERLFTVLKSIDWNQEVKFLSCYDTDFSTETYKTLIRLDVLHAEFNGSVTGRTAAEIRQDVYNAKQKAYVKEVERLKKYTKIDFWLYMVLVICMYTNLSFTFYGNHSSIAGICINLLVFGFHMIMSYGLIKKVKKNELAQKTLFLEML